MSAGWRVEGLEARAGPFRLGPVELELPPGGAVAVLGSSGAGKTTLLRALAGFVAIRAGRVLHDGEDVTRRPPEDRRLGYVPQGLGLLPHRSVERNVAYPLEIRRAPDMARRTRELLERFDLGPLARRSPVRLSGGEQQRVALARALAADPALVVWDEPWQGLDAVARHELGRVLADLRAVERVPVVLVTHDPALAFSVADRFLVLRAGRVQEWCDATTLLRTPADAFAARFVGFSNVFDPAELRGGPPGGFRRWLLDRAGPEGVAFARPILRDDPASAGPWSGVVRSARPTPEGVAVEAVADELLVALRLGTDGLDAMPGPGTSVRFHVPEGSLARLGGPRTPGGP